MRDRAEIKEECVEQCKQVFDPEIPVNIWDLGLIYEIEVYPPMNNVFVKMTVTAPNCPVADTMPLEVKAAIETIDGVGDVNVELTFDPPWDKEFMSEEAKLELDMF